MRKHVLFLTTFLTITIGCVVFLSPPAFAQFDRTYRTFLKDGQKALKNKDYIKALKYFQTAHKSAPQKKEALQYINYTTRIIQERVSELVPKKKKTVPRVVPRQASPKRIPSKSKPRSSKAVLSSNSVGELSAPRELNIPEETTQREVERIIELDGQLWKLQPDSDIEVEFRKSVILRGNQIDRFLIIDQGFITIERISRQEIRITGVRRGSTFLHVWDQTGRWTFNIKIIFPIQNESQRIARLKLTEEFEKPFRIEYTNDWGSLYRGDSYDTVERKNLSFRQWVGLFGDTPYGKFDASASLYKFDLSTEIVGKGIGLTDGKIGPFRDFTIRGFDTSKEFSELSLPTRYFRGGLLDAYAFQHKIRYTLIQGQDKATFSYLAPEVYEVRKSYIEGAKIILFPDEKNNYSFNYARGYGEVRSSTLKDKVYSIESRHQLGNFNFHNEFAYDEDESAYKIQTHYKKDDLSLYFNMRDINKDFYTITGRPTEKGEIGGNFLLNWDPKKFHLRTFLDVFRDRDLYNPDNFEEVNFDFTSNVTVPITNSDHFSTAVYYRHTPQLISPQDAFSVSNVYSKSMKFFDKRNLSVFIGNSYQRNRYELSPQSEYDRYSVRTGFRLPLVKYLNYFLNYEFNWVDAISSGEHSTPNVMTTGMSFSPSISKYFSANMSFNYRDEENAGDDFSFLGGEDSVTGNLSLRFTPVRDWNFFVDGRYSSVWAEVADRDAYNEFDVRCGVRAGWDTPFSWNPSTEIQGFVFKDFNGNGLKDEDEAGIPDARIIIGKKSATTNSNGYYWTTARAKNIQVNLNPDDIPSGYVLTTPLTRNVEVEHLGSSKINFGLTSRSGIYGVVFFDKNNNGSFDADDALVPKVKIFLDENKSIESDSSGSYFFESVSPGRHEIRIDINSIPLDYLPSIKLKNSVEVQEGTTYTFHIPLRAANQ